MGEYRHHVSGFFAQREEAQNAYDEIVERGVPGEQMQLFEADSPASGGAVQADSNKVLKNMVVDGTIGTAVGTGIGALAQLALGVANVSTRLNTRGCSKPTLKTRRSHDESRTVKETASVDFHDHGTPAFQNHSPPRSLTA